MKRQTQPVDSTAALGMDRDIGSRPVETTEHAAVTRETQVKIPRSQAFWVAWPFTVAIITTLVSPAFIAKGMFWLATGVVAFAAFWWSIIYEMKWQDRVSLPLLAGLFMSCFWIIFDWQGWRVSDAWQPFAGLASLASVIFWWTFTAALWLTFTQRLAQPVYHQQFSLWSAIGAILTYRFTREQVAEPQEIHPDLLPIPFEFISDNGHKRRYDETPFNRGTMIWVARILQEETASEASLCGKDKPLRGRDELNVLKDWMVEHKLMAWDVMRANGDPVKEQGIHLTEDGEQWIASNGKWVVEEKESANEL